jgi:hypothetical protein
LVGNNCKICFVAFAGEVTADNHICNKAVRPVGLPDPEEFAFRPCARHMIRANLINGIGDKKYYKIDNKRLRPSEG